MVVPYSMWASRFVIMNRIIVNCKCGTKELMAPYCFNAKDSDEYKRNTILCVYDFDIVTYVCHVCNNRQIIAIHDDVEERMK